MWKIYLISTLLLGTFASDINLCLQQAQNFQFSINCSKLLLSKLIGYLMILGSLTVKFPQLIKIISSGSIQGLSLSSFYFQAINFSLTTSYNIHRQQPFSTYGQNAIITVQCLMQCILYWFYAKTPTNQIFSAVVFFTFGWCLPLLSEIFPESFWMVVPIISIVINFVVKSTQILENYNNGSTGQLSFITNFMNLTGTLSRIFTTLVELSDSLLVANYGIGSVLNFVLVGQLIYYWNVSPDKKDT